MRRLTGVLVVGVVLCGAHACTEVPLAVDSDLAQPDAELVFAAVCSDCHSLTQAASVAFTSRDEACVLVQRMAVNGVRLTEAEEEAITDYLWEHHGLNGDPHADW